MTIFKKIILFLKPEKNKTNAPDNNQGSVQENNNLSEDAENILEPSEAVDTMPSDILPPEIPCQEENSNSEIEPGADLDKKEDVVDVPKKAESYGDAISNFHENLNKHSYFN